MFTAYFNKKDGLVLADRGMTDKVWRAEDLKARLTYLALVGIDDDGELEWCGTKAEWDMVGGPTRKTDYFQSEFANGEDDFDIDITPCLI